MSTRTEFDREAYATALSEVDAVTRNLKTSTVLTELQLIVERLTFSGIAKSGEQNGPKTMAELDLYFRDEISEGMLQFIRSMAERESLQLLADDNGTIFLEYCINEYRKIQEVNVTTAVILEVDEKLRLEQKLRERFPDPARINIVSSPSLIAGLTIDTGDAFVDLSLRAHISNVLSKSVQLNALASEAKDES